MNELRVMPADSSHEILERVAILILGMHRTGTSALSGFIHLLGADAPARFDHADHFNPKGYWESKAIREFNDRVLERAGSDWKDWDKSAAVISNEEEIELADIIAKEYGGSRLFVIKDPRLCRFASFLLAALKRQSIEPRIVIPVRNPLEAALSLFERDQMPLEEGLLLWLRHMLDAEKVSRDHRRCFVSFDHLLTDWRGVAQHIAATLSVRWPERSVESDRRIDDFLTHELRHHRVHDQALETRAEVHEWVSATHEILREFSVGGEATTAALNRLDEIRAEFDQVTRVLRPIVRKRDLLVRDVTRGADAIREELDATRHELAASKQELTSEHSSSERIQAEADEARHRIQEEAKAASQQITELENRMAMLNAEVARRIAEANAYRADVDAARAALARSEKELGTQAHVRSRSLDEARQQSARELILARLEIQREFRKRDPRPDAKRRPGWPLGARLAKKLHLPRSKVNSSRERELRRAELIRASGLFDSDWYLRQYPDVAKAGIDPAIHYLRYGGNEGRDPSAHFSSEAYRQRYLDVAEAGTNPLVHFLEFGINEARQFEPSSHVAVSDSSDVQRVLEPDIPVIADDRLTAEHLQFSRRGDRHEDFDPAILNGTTPDVKLVAFYLPQFHAIPENDKFWGKGFTEWRQISRGLPRFPGHYQPRIPSDLGFYDLTSTSVLHQQVEMAKAAGIHGFGFYYYRFDSLRVLEKPLEALLASPDIDMPFMLIWANENWTRTWDGMSGQMLLRQSYDRNDETELLADLARHFTDRRYIRIKDRPLFVIYQPRHVPDGRATFARWRERWRNEFGLEPLFFMAQTFGSEDPTAFGLDGAMEFPPHKLTSYLPGRPVPDAFSPAFTGRVVSYDDVVAASLNEVSPAFPLIKTIVPSWDNDARRPLRGTTIEGSTPGKYQNWLFELARRSRANPIMGESIVAVNAWNEWAEGAYLEPDVYYGAAYLNATAQALLQSTPVEAQGSKLGVVLVGHDTFDFGAQRLLLNIGRTLTRRFGLRIQYVLLGGGPLRAEYEATGSCVFVLGDVADQVKNVLGTLAGQGFELAIVNTSISGKVVEHAKAAGFKVASLVHELPEIIRSHGLEKNAAAIARASDVVVFAGKLVHERFEQLSGGIKGRALVKPQGLYRTEVAPDETARARVRAELNLPPDAKIVLNVGFADARKGFDLFAGTAKALGGERSDVYFLWIGQLEYGTPNASSHSAACGEVITLGFRDNVAEYYSAADAFFLSSREDPYPSVVLEAMAAGLPVVGFSGATGCEQLIGAHGILVPGGDVVAAATAIGDIVDLPEDIGRSARSARIAEIRANYDFRDYCFWLVQQLEPSLKRVSVLVPNYNHQRYLRERLKSIFNQSHPVYEVVILDDASVDGSVDVIRQAAGEFGRDVVLLANETNSGSIARQWRKGLDRCKGDLVWIAEADDVCSPKFLSETARALERSQAGFCFADSWQIDGEGNRTGDSYVPYVDDAGAGLFRTDFAMAGQEFLRRWLCAKNVILNMSGVLWHRESLARALTEAGSEIETLRLAADWRLYIAACIGDRNVAYLAKALNGHRRHDGGVTSSLDKQRHVDEVLQMQTLCARLMHLDEDVLSRAERHLDDIHHHLDLSARKDLMSVRDIDVCRQFGEELDVKAAVHPADFIFRFLISHPGFQNRPSAIEYYFRDGRKSAEMLRALLDELGVPDRNPTTLLEFASGYGCVTRHAPRVLPNVDWTACDIHQDAALFIERELGAKCILPANVLGPLPIGKKFDVVFVLSFFSRLPENAWGEWLSPLYDLVGDGGHLIFTTQGIASAKHFGDPEIPASGVWFRPDNERNTEASRYGQSIVTPDFVAKTIAREISRDMLLQKPGYWWEHQDLYVIRKI